MMKRFVLFGVLACLVGGSFAQTDMGDFLVGGNLGFRTNKNSSNFSLTPTVGYFFAKNLAVGANVTLSFQKEGSTNSNALGLGPFVRYYLGAGNLRPFLNGGVGYLNNTVKSGGFKNTTNGLYTTLGLGAAAFINPSVAFEGIAAYNYTKVQHAGGASGFSLNFGFLVYITNSKMATLRQGKLNE
jgi:outer membrane protein W